MKRLLFVCTGNVDRSRTAEEIFEKIKGVEAKSAGTSIAATIPLTKELIQWADKIFVMEYKHQKVVLKMDPEAWEKIECLAIPDKYAHGEPELKRLLKERLRPYLSVLSMRTNSGEATS